MSYFLKDFLLGPATASGTPSLRWAGTEVNKNE